MSVLIKKQFYVIYAKSVDLDIGSYYTICT